MIFCHSISEKVKVKSHKWEWQGFTGTAVVIEMLGDFSRLDKSTWSDWNSGMPQVHLQVPIKTNESNIWVDQYHRKLTV